MAFLFTVRAGGHPARTRLTAAAAALVTVGAGLGLRATTTGDVAKYGGDALYTLLVFALVVVVAPRSTPPKAAGVALAVSWGVEFAQLTGVPAELSGRSTAARLVLGSTFNAPDLLWYAVGAAVGWLVASGCARWRGRRHAGGCHSSHAGVMANDRPIVIYPPGDDGGRRVRAGVRFLGMAYGLLDVVEFLRLAGLESVDDDWLRDSTLVEWRGGGPDAWTARA